MFQILTFVLHTHTHTPFSQRKQKCLWWKLLIQHFIKWITYTNTQYSGVQHGDSNECMHGDSNECIHGESSECMHGDSNGCMYGDSNRCMQGDSNGSIRCREYTSLWLLRFQHTLKPGQGFWYYGYWFIFVVLRVSG